MVLTSTRTLNADGFLQDLCALVWVKLIHRLLIADHCCFCCTQHGISMITVHCSFLYLLLSILPHPTHIQETQLPAGRGSAQRRLQPVRKNSHLAPSCLPSPSNPSVSHISCAPSLAPITPLFLGYPPPLAI